MVATCDHVADVYHALSNPRFRLEAALTASMHSLSQDVYARTQEAGGLRFYRLRGIMREYHAGLLRVADFASSIWPRPRSTTQSRRSACCSSCGARGARCFRGRSACTAARSRWK